MRLAVDVRGGAAVAVAERATGQRRPGLAEVGRSGDAGVAAGRDPAGHVGRESDRADPPGIRPLEAAVRGLPGDAAVLRALDAADVTADEQRPSPAVVRERTARDH